MYTERHGNSRISVIIPTHNRCADLKETCARLVSMCPPPDEILVCVDGCTDGTLEMLRESFPSVRVLRNDRRRGSVESRNALARAATGDILVSLDDDSHPVAVDFFERIGGVFARHPEAAVVSLPELRNDGSYATPSKTSASHGHAVSAYANCASAMRRAVYLTLPGFPPFFTHMYEEPDYALQCQAAGWTVWFEPSLTIRHRMSADGRSEIARHQQHARNEVWSVWMRCPLPWLLPVTAFRAVRQFQHAWSIDWRWAAKEPQWWWQALRGLSECVQRRQPIEWRVYLRWMRLARRVPTPGASADLVAESAS